jgi:hypothetical protein
MPRMIELIRSSTANSSVMQTAARGALHVPPQEMIEILVYLATQTKIFAERARLTLAGWDEASSRAAAADPQTPKEVLAYMITPGNLRPTLLPALLENPSVTEESLVQLAGSASRYMVETLIKSTRVNQSRVILTSLSSNPHLNPNQSAAVAAKLSSFAPASTGQCETAAPSPQSTSTGQAEEPAVPQPATAEAATEVPDEDLSAFLAKHATEISAEGDKPFQPIGGMEEELTPQAAAAHCEPVPVEAARPAASTAHGAGTAVQRAPVKKKVYLSAEEERGSALQKIAKLDIKGRIQLAMKGTKEERSILIRDGTKIVALAVLESPKITDSEVEKIANQKNVLEAVLREISMKRRFIKQYAILRNLTFNPRTPIDVSLGLIKHLLTADLRNLTGNKEVADTVRKLATRMFRQKLETTGKKD